MSRISLLLLYAWFSFAQNASDRAIVRQSSIDRQATSGGTLIVSNRQGGRGDEGYIDFFMIRSASGTRVDEMNLPGGSRAYLLFSLRAGREYELLTYVRDCDGNCSSLDPPREECRARFRLKPDQTLYAKRLPIPPRGRSSASSTRCSLTFSSQP